ncbi:MurR/RpiR family transcriptional regulator [Peptostreptococcus canis]|uniref:MurR/RpiR family transcriptional regulator n=1 Tax=Peptostreptococcus canis TaxID=1159213 RepID=A0ABR6TK45_9FIRM|nr:MurR/RpiR family transcriptional regulator [Peptostreptococcus canis]MBC2575779.1 MurR/RpiR family transcriptional regulator [Peptostreptococcus canis]MBP1998106.1 DNA-binding MurR/RpiR family transcriptional regulator [Peptostreptococcus canis]
MSIMGNLTKPNFKTTKSDKLLMKYILENIENIPHMQISEMAKEVGTGEATITRCVKKLGCRGFQEFKVELAKEITVKRQNNIIISSIKQDESIFDTASKLAVSNIGVIEEMLAIVDEKSIKLVAKKILESRKMYIVGIGFSGVIALDTFYRFARIGIDCNSFDSTHMMAMMASIMRKGDILLAISQTGETSDIIRTVDIAKNNDAEIISVIGNKNSTLAKKSDINLVHYYNESLSETGSMTSKMAQYFILDLVYTEVVKMSIIESTNTKLKTVDAVFSLNI